MSSRTVITCDICHKEIPKPGLIKIRYVAKIKQIEESNDWRKTRKYDICFDCQGRILRAVNKEREEND